MIKLKSLFISITWSVLVVVELQKTEGSRTPGFQILYSSSGKVKN